MMRKWGLRFIIALFLGIVLTTMIVPTCFAASNNVIRNAIDKQYLGGDQFVTDNSLLGKKIGATNGTLGELILKVFSIFLALIRIIALGWAIIMLISVAIKYMSGSPQIKAQLKTDVPTYMIGAAILFGASGILTILKWLVDDVL